MGIVISLWFNACSQFNLNSQGFVAVDQNDLIQKGDQAYRQKDFAGASRYYELAFQANQDDATLPYNLACTYALQGNEEKAVYFLEGSFRNGFRGLDLFLADKDFDPIRSGTKYLEIETEIKDRFKSIGSQDYVTAKSFLPFRIRFPANFNASKAYPLLIGLHGNGGNADGFISNFNLLDDPQFIYAAPEGQYDLSSNIGPTRHARSWALPGSPRSMWLTADSMVEEYVKGVILKLRSHYKVSTIYLVGYSQGAAFAYTIALRNPESIAGVIGLSGYLMEVDKPYSLLSAEDITQAASLRVFMGHGKQDAAISVDSARELKTLFEEHGLAVTYREYEGGHGIDPNIFREAVDWMVQ